MATRHDQEAALNGPELVTLLMKNAYVLREDIQLMEQGPLKVQAFGSDVTVEHAGRLKANLSRIEGILASCGHVDS